MTTQPIPEATWFYVFNPAATAPRARLLTLCKAPVQLAAVALVAQPFALLANKNIEAGHAATAIVVIFAAARLALRRAFRSARRSRGFVSKFRFSPRFVSADVGKFQYFLKGKNCARFQAVPHRC